MNALLIVILLAAGLGALTLARTSLLVATAAAAAGLLVLHQLAGGPIATIIMVLAWLGWAAMAALNFTDFRRALVTEPALNLFRSVMPPMSDTEKDALDAGTVWWDAELFSGRPDWAVLKGQSPEILTDAEQAFIDGPTETLCGMLDEWEISRAGDLPPDVWQYIKQEGFFGIIIPREFGGLGFSARAHSRIVSKISSRSGTAGVTVMVPNSLGPAELLLKYGTEAQRNHYLPRLARGEEVPCFGLTNPHAGSDAASIPDTGVVCRGMVDGEEVLGLRVAFEKRYITLAPVATVVGLAFRLRDPDGLLGGPEDVGITLALIPATTPGMEIGRRHSPGSQAFQNGPVSGTDVFIPMDWVIGGQERCGDGWRMLMNCLAAGRSISLPASSSAALKVCARATGAYAAVRHQFNLPIGKFEGVQEALARIAADCYVVDAARDVTAGAIDQGEEPAVLSALLKYESTERGRRAINDAMDVHGGRAICDGPSNYLMRAYTATPIGITVEGANILTRSLIVFGQGAMRCHPYLLREVEAARESDPTRALEKFDAALMAHVGHACSTLSRAFVKNLSGGLIGPDPSIGEVNYWYGQLDRASASFAATAEIALLNLGGALKRKEMLSGRFADIFGELYLLSSTLKRFDDEGRPAAMMPIVDYACTRGLYRIESSLKDIIDNLPSRMLATMLSWVVFPRGRNRRPPSDKQTAAVAEALIGSETVRRALSDGIYFPDDADDPMGCLEHAFKLQSAAREAQKLVLAAVKAGTIPVGGDIYAAALEAGVIDEAQAARLRQALQAVRRAIDVDDFAPTELWSAAAAPQHAHAA